MLEMSFSSSIIRILCGSIWGSHLQGHGVEPKFCRLLPYNVPGCQSQEKNNMLWKKVVQPLHIVFYSLFWTLIEHSCSPKHMGFSVAWITFEQFNTRMGDVLWHEDRPDTQPEIEPYFWDITNQPPPSKRVARMVTLKGSLIPLKAGLTAAQRTQSLFFDRYHAVDLFSLRALRLESRPALAGDGRWILFSNRFPLTSPFFSLSFPVRI